MRKILLLLVVLLLFIQMRCEKDKECIQPDRCTLEPDPGPCEALIPKYYYDQKDKVCKSFIWGGCEGTVPFETLEECEKCKCND